MAKKLKYLRPEQVEEFEQMDNETLFKELNQAMKAVLVESNRKRDDVKLNEIKKEIKDHMDKHSLRKELEELKLQVKELKESIEDEIEELILDKKAIEGGFRDSIGSFKETRDVLFNILRDRL